MEDRRHDIETRDRIQEIADSNAKKLKQLKHILYALVLVTTFTTISAAFLIADNRGRADRINKSRAINMYNNCVDQNERNENTKKVLHEKIAESIASGQITANGGAASEAFTKLLIDALAPHRDCSKLVLNQEERKPTDKRTISALSD